MSRPAPRSHLSVPDIRSVPVFIYALTDAVGTVHYVGKSDRPQFRLESHQKFGSFAMRRWLLGLARPPGLKILYEVPPGADSAAIELAYIEAYLRVNPSLLNTHGTGRRAFVKPRPARQPFPPEWEAAAALDALAFFIAGKSGRFTRCQMRFRRCGACGTRGHISSQCARVRAEAS